MRRVAFLDRDGVINQKAPEGEYILRDEEVRIIPGVETAIGRLNQAGFEAIIVTNQRCVAKGLITTSNLEAMNRRICETLALGGARIEAVYYCPHDLQPPCSCRKPAPGMLLTAAHERQIDLANSWMIGDSTADVSAGRTAGCKTALLSGDAHPVAEIAEVIAPSLLDAVVQILRLEKLGSLREAV